MGLIPHRKRGVRIGLGIIPHPNSKELRAKAEILRLRSSNFGSFKKVIGFASAMGRSHNRKIENLF